MPIFTGTLPRPSRLNYDYTASGMCVKRIPLNEGYFLRGDFHVIQGKLTMATSWRYVDTRRQIEAPESPVASKKAIGRACKNPPENLPAGRQGRQAADS